MFAHLGLHWHVNIIERQNENRAMLIHDYTTVDPNTAILQFASLVALVEEYEFEEVRQNLTAYFQEALDDEVEAGYVVVGGSQMAEGIYECTEPCRISPSMN